MVTVYIRLASYHTTIKDIAMAHPNHPAITE